MKLSGISASPGVAMGRVLLYEPYSITNETWAADSLECGEEKLHAYEQAKAAAMAELKNSSERCGINEGNTAILEAHRLLLEDVAIDEDIRAAIMSGQKPSEAIAATYQRYIDLLLHTDDGLTQERAADMRDVCSRLLRCLAGKPEKSLSSLPNHTVIVAKELNPSDTATIDREHIAAIVTEEGGLTSHTVILARSYNIPAVIGVTGIFTLATDGDELLADAVTGQVYINPAQAERVEWSRSMEQFQAAQQSRNHYYRKDAVTMDGVRILVELNLSGGSAQQAEAGAVDGVGLLRSEFLYLGRHRLPDEEEQFAFYRGVLERFTEKPVILRTMDIGGDKQAECLSLPKEDNPFLGKRGLRLCFDKTDLFHTQLRAALRASAYGDLRLMFPMVGSLDDWRKARQLVCEVMEELRMQKLAFNPAMPLGIMIEIPSIALMAEEIAAEADFASIGTNDLCQYLMAADRMNPGVALYHQPFHPAVFRVLRPVAQAFARHGKPLGVCGEMGGDPAAALALMGLGIRCFSMCAPAVADMKRMVCNVTIKEAGAAAEAVCAARTEDEVKKILAQYTDVINLRTPERGKHAALL